MAAADDTLAFEEETIAERGIVVLRLAGNISAKTFEALEARIKGIFERGIYKIIIDLSLVGYVSSSAAGVFMNALSEAHDHQGHIVLMSPTQKVREVLELLNLTGVFKLADGREAALANF